MATIAEIRNRIVLSFGIFCGLLLALPAHLAAQDPPSGTFTSHSDGQTVTSSSITITWKGCSNAPQDVYQTRLNGAGKPTTQSTGMPCIDYSVVYNYSASGTLNYGANTLFLRVCDINACDESTITVYYNAADVSVTPDGATAPSVPHRTSGSYGFTVTNTGGIAATASFSHSCTGAIDSCSVSAASAFLAASASTTVTVSYTGASVGSGQASLTATYDEYPTTSNYGFVNVTVTENPIWGVSVVPLNPSQSVSPGTAPIRFSVTNTSQYTSTPSTFTLTTTVTGSVSSCSLPATSVTLYPGDPGPIITATCDIASSGTGGSVRLDASTSSPASFSANGTTNVTIAPTYNVTLTAVSSKTEPARTTSSSVVYTITNNSQNTGPIMFSFERSCTGVTTCGDPIAGVSVAQGSSANVTFPYDVSLTGTTGQISLTANSVAPSQTHAVSIATTPDYAISVSSASSQTLAAASTTGSTQYTIDNTSANSASALVINLGASCTGIISSCSPSQSQVTIAHGGQATPSVSYGVSLIGQTADVTLTASPGSPSFATKSSTTAVTATPGYTVSVTPATPSQTLPAQTTSGSGTYTIQNTSTNTSGPITYTLTATCTGIASCTAPQGTMALAQGASNTQPVSYNVSFSGTTGSVALAASSASPSVTAVTGTTTLTATPYYAVSVTPITSSQTLAAQTTSGSRIYTIENTSTNASGSITFTLTATCTGIASCAASQGTMALAQGASNTQPVSYDVSFSGTTGSVALAASSASPSITAVTGTTTLTATPYYAIAVMPATGNPTVGVGTSNSHSVNIQNLSKNSANAITVSLASPPCTGVTLGGCSVPSNSAAIAQGAQTAALIFSYTALASGSETVALNASGTVSGGTVQVTNASLGVTVVFTPGSLAVVTAGRNPRTTIDRSSCLTIAAGQNAAFECGDLRVVHPLPATVTMDRARGPALIYNSRHANPSALLAADVTYTGVAPAILRATVAVPGQSNITRDFTWSSACAGQTCRIVVPIPTTQATGLYAPTLQVSAINGSDTSATSSSVTDTVTIVNRAASPYGAGWWLDGLENLVTVSPTRMLWVGGDGSTRLYTRTADTTVYTVAPAYDRPDTLKRLLGAPQTWRRLLGDSAYVEFDSAGQHARTVNALGWITRFVYTGALLDSIVLPVPSGSGQVFAYRFSYTSSLLDSVRAPMASFSRTTRVTRGGTSRINSITDPDGLASEFGYDGSNRIITRRNKLSDTTYFQYDDGGALKQAKLSTARTEGADSAITTNFRAAETRSVFSAADLPTPLARAYSQLDGPRVDIGDTTNFLVNRWGAPDTVTNALGQRTRLSRGNATFPALVTNVIVPGGFETRAYFNARALTDSTVAVDPYGTGANAVTRFGWNPMWMHVDSVIGPTGERTRTFYWSTKPLVDSVRMGTNVARRVKFTYTADGQLQSVAEPAGLPDSVLYDALGNATKTWTPMGRAASTPYFTEAFKDAIGRDTLVVHPISGDTTGNTRILFDAADRVIQTVESGPARPYALPMSPSFTPDTAMISALVRTDTSGYDAEGNLTYKRSRSTPWSDAEVTDRLAYDAAGRLRSRDIGSGPDSMVYDPAGNMISMLFNSGLWGAQSYDVLNRLVQRVVPQRKYPSQRCTGYSPGPISGSPCFMIFPYHPNAGDSLKIVADTARFVYDAVGNMMEANNRYARVRRTYYRGGALKTDSTAIGSYASPLVDGTTRGQQYVYDLAGKRTSMQWFLGTNGYGYNDFGALSTVTDPNSNQYGIRYTLAGQVDSLLLGTGVTEDRNYDNDGRMTYRNRVSTHGSLGTLGTNTFVYDRMNRMIHAAEQNYQQLASETRISYDGLGAVLASEQSNAFGANVEEFRNDPLGNVLYRRTRRTAGGNDAPFTFQYSPQGELMTSFSHLSNPAGQGQLGDTLKQSFASEQLIREDRMERNPNDGSISLELATRHYYGADDKLMAVQRYSWRGPSLSDGTWEEYWYDALGRRVLTRARRDPSSIYDAFTSGPLCMGGIHCRSFTERVWWDGDQALVEERTPEGTTDVSNSGLVGNIHGLTLDEPLAVITDQTRIVNYNWRGLGQSSVFPNGQAGDAALGNTATEIDWPALTQAQTYFTPGPGSGGSSNPKRWMGTFVANGQGTTGMLYRRNRYFSPTSGQFTQADPIGIAGGMNAFGFAEGDPVNFSDPFGLCPPKDENQADCEQKDPDAKDPARTTAQRVGDFTAGFGDFVTFGTTKTIRERWDCEGCVDYGSGAYTAGQIAGGVAGLAEGGLLLARGVGVTSRIAIHGAHHTFPIVGEAAHVQVNVWRIGVKGSGMAFRILLPWR